MDSQGLLVRQILMTVNQICVKRALRALIKSIHLVVVVLRDSQARSVTQKSMSVILHLAKMAHVLMK
jgi:hypothetical protein